MNINELPKWALPLVTGVAGLAVGGVVGYFVGKREVVHKTERYTYIPGQLELDFDKDYHADVVLAPEVDLGVEAPKIPPGARVVNNGVVVETVERESIPPKPEPEEFIYTEVFPGVDGVPNWDYDKEIAARRPHIPYVIHRDEFFGQEMGYDQVQWTWYQGDETMADQVTDRAVYEWNEHLELIEGVFNLTLLFGHGSGDPHLVYMRSEERNMEYEILLDPGKYSDTDVGSTIRHSEDREHLIRFRLSDED